MDIGAPTRPDNPIGGVARRDGPDASPVARKLDLVDKLYQDSILPHAVAVARGQRLRAPLVIDLDPTSYCDLACPECISSGVLNKGRFPATRLAALAQEIAAAGVKAVILIGGGEPLMHTGTRGAIRTLHAAGVKLGLVTNGTLIDRYLPELGSMLAWVRVSMDAATQKTYDLFRPSGRAQSVFPKVIDNMRRLAAVKRGRLGYSFLLMQRFDADNRLVASNYGEVEAAGRLARDIGCDYLEVKVASDNDHFVVDQDAAAVAEVMAQIEALRPLETGTFKLLEADSWKTLRDGRGARQVKGYAKCLVSELRATVTPSGVYPCAYHRGHDDLRLGDVQAMGFEEMWARADINGIVPARDCQFACARHPSNLALEALGASRAAPEPVADYDLFF